MQHFTILISFLKTGDILLIALNHPQTIKSNNNNNCKYIIVLGWKMICHLYNLANTNNQITAAVLFGSGLTDLILGSFCPFPAATLDGFCV